MNLDNELGKECILGEIRNGIVEKIIENVFKYGPCGEDFVKERRPIFFWGRRITSLDFYWFNIENSNRGFSYKEISGVNNLLDVLCLIKEYAKEVDYVISPAYHYYFLNKAMESYYPYQD